MPLEFSYLSEVFPEFIHSDRSEFLIGNEAIDLIEASPPFYTPEFFSNHRLISIPDIKIGQKLRINKDGKLEIDNRRFQCIARKLTGDSRYKVLEKLKELSIDTTTKKLIDTLCITYAKDKKWIEEAKNLINKSSVNCEVLHVNKF